MGRFSKHRKRKWQQGRGWPAGEGRWNRNLKVRMPKPTTSHGVYAYLGPPESGKTLLAITHADRYATRHRPCFCGDASCEIGPAEGWKVFTNLESTWSWAEPADVAKNILDQDGELNHAVVIVDEFQRYAHARQAMKKSNIKMVDFVSQRRKLGQGSTKLFLTTQSVNLIDKMVREQLTRTFNCWNPWEGREIYASVEDRQMGHLPPWMRNRPPAIKSWRTGHMFDKYDRYELIDDRAADDYQIEPAMVVQTPDGREVLYYLKNMMSDALADHLDEGHDVISVDQLVDAVSSQFEIEPTRRQAASWLGEKGFQVIRDVDGNEVYQLRVRRAA